jgi:DNA-binding MarR family transcriptional regulator
MSRFTVFDRLLELSVLLGRDMGSAFEGTGLTTARTHLLWELHRLGPSTQVTLASALDVSARNVSGLVDALERSGYVIRSAHPSDRRATVVSLSESGAETMRAMADDHRHISALLEGALEDPARFEQELGRLIEMLRGLMEESAPSGDGPGHG